MGIKKTSPSHLSISKFQPQQSFYTKNYLKHNKPSQIKQNKQQTNISPPKHRWFWGFAWMDLGFFILPPNLSPLRCYSPRPSSCHDHVRQLGDFGFQALLLAVDPREGDGGKGYGGKVRKKMSFRETTKGGCTEKNPKFTRDTEKCWFGTGIETASNMATLGIYVKFPGGNLCSNQNMLRKNLINGW